MMRFGILLFSLFQLAQADTHKEYWKNCPGPGCPARQEDNSGAAASREDKEILKDKLDAIKSEENKLHMEKEKLKEEIKSIEKGEARVIH